MLHRAKSAVALVAAATLASFGSVASAANFANFTFNAGGGLLITDPGDTGATTPAVTLLPIVVTNSGALLSPSTTDSAVVGAFTDVNINGLRIQRVGDIKIELVAPNGTAVTLTAPSRLDETATGGNYSFNNTSLNTLAGNDIIGNPTNSSGIQGFSGSNRAAGPLPTVGAVTNDTARNAGSFGPGTSGDLSAFNGVPLDGTWNLRITDNYAGNTAYGGSGAGLQRIQFGASFDATPAAPPVPEPAALSLVGVTGAAALRRRRQRQA